MTASTISSLISLRSISIFRVVVLSDKSISATDAWSPFGEGGGVVSNLTAWCRFEGEAGVSGCASSLWDRFIFLLGGMTTEDGVEVDEEGEVDDMDADDDDALVDLLWWAALLWWLGEERCTGTWMPSDDRETDLRRVTMLYPMMGRRFRLHAGKRLMKICLCLLNWALP